MSDGSGADDISGQVERCTDSKSTVASLVRESRYLGLQTEIRALQQNQELVVAPLRAEIDELERHIERVSFGMKLSRDHRDVSGSPDLTSRLLTEDRAAIKIAEKALQRKRTRLRWVLSVWGEALRQKTGELGRVQRAMGPRDNLLRAGEARLQQAEPPPGQTVEHEP